MLSVKVSVPDLNLALSAELFVDVAGAARVCVSAFEEKYAHDVMVSFRSKLGKITVIKKFSL